MVETSDSIQTVLMLLKKNVYITGVKLSTPEVGDHIQTVLFCSQIPIISIEMADVLFLYYSFESMKNLLTTYVIVTLRYSLVGCIK